MDQINKILWFLNKKSAKNTYTNSKQLIIWLPFVYMAYLLERYFENMKATYQEGNDFSENDL